jgi:hypothetical protein
MAISEWAVVLDTPEDLNAFLASEAVAILVGFRDQDVAPIILHCGFWRQYGLFDLREELPEEPVEE